MTLAAYYQKVGSKYCYWGLLRRFYQLILFHSMVIPFLVFTYPSSFLAIQQDDHRHEPASLSFPTQKEGSETWTRGTHPTCSRIVSSYRYVCKAAAPLFPILSSEAKLQLPMSVTLYKHWGFLSHAIKIAAHSLAILILSLLLLIYIPRLIRWGQEWLPRDERSCGTYPCEPAREV